MFSALRPHHWVKSLLVFVPLVTSHRLFEAGTFASALLAFLAFSFCSSGVYVLNDLLDLEADRAHPAKRERPFASGRLPLAWGPRLAVAALVASALVASRLPPGFWAILASYLVLTTAYSLRLKAIPLLDVFCLAGFYTLRMLAGHAVTDIPYSPWLLAFSMFFFLGLATLKRCSELARLHSSPGRGYSAADAELLLALGFTSSILSVLVFALYINSAQVALLYMRPAFLWGIAPLLLYWVSRIWLLARRGRVDDDPVVFAIKDPASYLAGALVAALLFAAAG